MGLFSFLQRPSTADAPRAGTPDAVQAARSRARRRLIGAAVLLGIGVIGFPLVFETQPRPIPVDIAIDIPRKDNAPSLPLPPPRTASAAPATAHSSSGLVDRPAEPRREAASAPAPTSTPRNETAPRSETTPRSDTAARSDARTQPTAATPANTPKPATKPDASADDGARARALLEGQGAASAVSGVGAPKPSTQVAAATPASPAATDSADSKADPANQRFVVQVGAYGEATSARDMRQKVEKLGLKSYTQVVQVEGARRIRVRVGPFNGREDAEKAAGTLKAAGLPAAVMTP